MKDLQQALEALEALMRRDTGNTCQHENTHRGGGIWEICDECGAKWADDRGGKPKWEDPPEWVVADKAISALRAVPQPLPAGCTKVELTAEQQAGLTCRATHIPGLAAPQPTTLKLSSDGAAVVNPDTFWIPITKENMPIEGARYLLINRSAGMTQVAPFKNDGWYTHYAGMPKFKD